jgi:hypothetical protein
MSSTFFVTIKDNIFTGVHCGDIENGLDNSPFEGEEKVVVSPDTKITIGEPINYYTDDYQRIPNIDLMKSGIMPIPEDYKIEGDELVELTSLEKIIARGSPVPKGFKLENNELVEKSLEEQLADNEITEEDYSAIKTSDAQNELNRRLSIYTSEESKAQAEIDEDYAQIRKNKLRDLLGVKQQEGWPLNINWPEET